MAKSKTSKAADAYSAARENDYIQRLLDDPEVRDTLKDAYDSARSAYDRVASNGRSPVQAVQKDKKLQTDLKNAADSLREASDALRGGKKASGGGIGKFLVLLLITGGVALALSDGARKAVMDALFGAEEEFEYTSTTSNSGA